VIIYTVCVCVQMNLPPLTQTHSVNFYWGYCSKNSAERYRSLQRQTQNGNKYE